MSRTNYKADILRFYDGFFNYHPPTDPGAVAWSSIDTQVTRFKILCDIGLTAEDTVLDLGCGMCALSHYLVDNLNYDLKNYTGIDINRTYIYQCKPKYPRLKLLVGEIYDADGTYDYILASGTFTVLMSTTETLEALHEAYRKCKKGIAVNFLTKTYLKDTWVNSYDPQELYNTISQLFPQTKLVIDYLGTEDFTIYIYKPQENG